MENVGCGKRGVWKMRSVENVLQDLVRNKKVAHEPLGECVFGVLTTF